MTTPRRSLRTSLRLSASAIVLVSFACCAGPTETVEEASEAMSPLPPSNPSPTLTVAPRPTAEELAQIEQFMRDNLPRWKVYLGGRDYYFSARDAQAVKRFFRDPMELDRHCALVLVPEDGDTRPETWITLSYQRYWTRGAAYLTDELKLSVFDILAILLALEDAHGHVPPLRSLERDEDTDTLRYEDGPYGVVPLVPPDWIVDNHTWAGGPPSIEVRPSAPKPPWPAHSPPPRSQDWWTWPVKPPPRHTGPRLDGILPGDKPVGKYPGWDKPHPGEWWQKFRCGGQVWEGYKSDCPDYQPRPIDERWKTPFSEVARQMAENAGQTLELLRTDPNCTFMCKLIAAMPALLHTVCIEAPIHPAMKLICAVFASLKVTIGAGIAGLKFDDACEKWCQQPPRVSPGGRP